MRHTSSVKRVMLKGPPAELHQKVAWKQCGLFHPIVGLLIAAKTHLQWIMNVTIPHSHLFLFFCNAEVHFGNFHEYSDHNIIEPVKVIQIVTRYIFNIIKEVQMVYRMFLVNCYLYLHWYRYFRWILLVSKTFPVFHSLEMPKNSNLTLKKKQFCTLREENLGNVLVTSRICLKYLYHCRHDHLPYSREH